MYSDHNRWRNFYFSQEKIHNNLIKLFSINCFSSLTILFLCLLQLTVLTVLSDPIKFVIDNNKINNNDNKWKPIKDFISLVDNKNNSSQINNNLALANTKEFMKTSESVEKISRVNSNENNNNNNKQIFSPSCARIFQNQIIEALASQTQFQQEKQSLVNNDNNKFTFDGHKSSNLIKEKEKGNLDEKKNVLNHRKSRSLLENRNTNTNNNNNNNAELDDDIYDVEEDDNNDNNSDNNSNSNERYKQFALTGVENLNQRLQQQQQSYRNDQNFNSNNNNDNQINELSDSQSLLNKNIHNNMNQRFRNEEPINRDDENQNQHQQQQQQPIHSNSVLEDEESLQRKEEEANESSELDALNKSALDEQQQQQREIILAQAEHEAKAIKEQKELLLKQQKLQQQMVFMRDMKNDLNLNSSDLNHINSLIDRKKINNNNNNEYKTKERENNNVNNNVRKLSRENNNNNNFDYDDLINKKIDINKNNRNLKLRPKLSFQIDQSEMIQEENRPEVLSSSILLFPSAQHNYGTHFGSLKKHQNHYYQYAESHKKGQYDSGFKRGNKKFKISGHSSQHKSHAEGHVKWKAKKGKGNHYWDYKHKGKKNHHYYYHH